MNYQPLTLPESLADCVEAAFHISEYNPEHSRERLVPDGAVSIVIELDGQPRSVYDNDTGAVLTNCQGAWVCGVHSNYITFDTPKQTELVGLRLLPGRAARIIGAPLRRINDRVVAGSEIFGDEILSLREDLRAGSGSQAKLEVLQGWLEVRINKHPAAPVSVAAAVAAIIEEPHSSGLEVSLERSGVSRKHLADLFGKFVGPTPKLFQRIMRFAAVFRVIQEQGEALDWSYISAECGYFDQSHFIRDFKRFSGMRPVPFGNRGTELLNFFPEDP